MELRIFKKIATSRFLTALECTKFVFDRGFAPGGPHLESLLRSPVPLAGLRGLTSKAQGEWREKGRER